MKNRKLTMRYGLSLAILLASLLTSCSWLQATPRSAIPAPVATGDGWETVSPAEVGFDSRTLAAMLADIQDGGYDNLYSLLIVKDGKLVFESYFHSHDSNYIDYVASVTKSVTSILVGIAIQQGLIQRPDQYLAELLPAYAARIQADPQWKKLQLKHLLTMTSGIDWDEDTYPYGSALNDATHMERSADAVQFILSRPIVREPGTQFQYCAANSMLLSAILQQAAGMTAADFAQANLFEPLGISQYHWDTYADGHTHTDGGLSMRSRDLAKLGQLMLNGGQWNGVQIVPPQWVAESTRAYVSAGPGTGYGYQWWRENQPVYLEGVETYFMAGFGGQLVNVYPDPHMVVVVTGEAANHDQNSFRIMSLRNKYLLPATIPAIFSKVFLWTWFLLTAASLVFLALEIRSGRLRGVGWLIAWLLMGVLFGPLGVAAYRVSYRRASAWKAPGWKAVGITSYFAMGNVIGLALVIGVQAWLSLDIGAVLLVIPISFLVSWLGFVTPLSARARGSGYVSALWPALLSALISWSFIMAGLFPVMVLLALRWFPGTVDLTSPLLWILISASGLAGALAAYPFSLWLAYRKLDFWPSVQEGAELTVEVRSNPSLRNAWWTLLLGLAVLIFSIRTLLMSLS